VAVRVDSTSGSGTQYASWSPNLGTSWQHYSMKFTPSTNDSVARLTFGVAGTARTIWLDAASFFPNSLLDPSFESASLPGSVAADWLFHANAPAAGTISLDSAAPEDGRYAARVAVTATSTDVWDIQLRQCGQPIVAGRSVTVSFWAKASSASPVQVVVQHGSSPWNEYAHWSVSPGLSWQPYAITFTPTVSDVNACVAFNLASTARTLWFDNTAFSSQ
jgi:hypothetical protein